VVKKMLGGASPTAKTTVWYVLLCLQGKAGVVRAPACCAVRGVHAPCIVVVDNDDDDDDDGDDMMMMMMMMMR